MRLLERYGLLPASLRSALDIVSNKRGPSAHGARPAARPFRAFEEFHKDLEQLVAALRDFFELLESKLNTSGEKAVERQQARQLLPVIVSAIETSHLTASLRDVPGKTVARVEYGERKQIEDVHQSEAIIIHFTDGSALGIDAHTNIGDLVLDHEDGSDDIRPEDLDVGFDLSWLPPA
jgi:hypothetical protein